MKLNKTTSAQCYRINRLIRLLRLVFVVVISLIKPLHEKQAHISTRTDATARYVRQDD